MTDEEEFAARSQLKWTRESDAWILSIAAGEWTAWSPITISPARGEASNPRDLSERPT